MDEQQTLDLGTVIILGTMGMIILAMGVVVFFFIYQRRMIAKQNELTMLELQHQKELMGAVIQTKELEQRRIALELHDDVGSTLTAIKFSVSSFTIGDKDKELLNNNLADAIQKVRRISNDLLPSILEELGLITAVKSLIKTLNDNKTINYVFESSGEQVRHPKDVELACYRVLQELLNNILKYAHATEVRVEIVLSQSGLVVIVTDDGDGFVPEDHTNRERPSLGLKNIESRIQQIKGEITYEKRLPKGTKVLIEWKRHERD
jgi:signal transduction histidine kinase